MSRREVVRKVLAGELGTKVKFQDVLNVLDHPLFLLDSDGPSLEEYQEFCRTARQALIERDLLEAARQALWPLAALEAQTQDCRECRVLCNLLVPADEKPNPEWVGSAV